MVPETSREIELLIARGLEISLRVNMPPNAFPRPQVYKSHNRIIGLSMALVGELRAVHWHNNRREGTEPPLFQVYEY